MIEKEAKYAVTSTDSFSGSDKLCINPSIHPSFNQSINQSINENQSINRRLTSGPFLSKGFISLEVTSYFSEKVLEI